MTARTGRPVQKFSLSGELLATYPNMHEAGRQNFRSWQAIRNAITGESQTCAGFIWKEIKPNRDHRKKQIAKCSLKGKILKIYGSIEEAVQLNDISRNMIYKVASGQFKTGNGYIWKFLD